MLFFPISQRIADYLNQDGKLEERKAVYCILSTAASGGLLGLALMLILALAGALSPHMLLLEMLVVVLGGLADSLRSFGYVERREGLGLKPGRRFVFLCFLPMIVFLVLVMLLMVMTG